MYDLLRTKYRVMSWTSSHQSQTSCFPSTNVFKQFIYPSFLPLKFLSISFPPFRPIEEEVMGKMGRIVYKWRAPDGGDEKKKMGKEKNKKNRKIKRRTIDVTAVSFFSLWRHNNTVYTYFMKATLIDVYMCLACTEW